MYCVSVCPELQRGLALNYCWFCLSVVFVFKLIIFNKKTMCTKHDPDRQSIHSPLYLPPILHKHSAPHSVHPSSCYPLELTTAYRLIAFFIRASVFCMSGARFACTSRPAVRKPMRVPDTVVRLLNDALILGPLPPPPPPPPPPPQPVPRRRPWCGVCRSMYAILVCFNGTDVCCACFMDSVSTDRRSCSSCWQRYIQTEVGGHMPRVNKRTHFPRPQEHSPGTSPATTPSPAASCRGTGAARASSTARWCPRPGTGCSTRSGPAGWPST